MKKDGREVKNYKIKFAVNLWMENLNAFLEFFVNGISVLATH